MCPLGSGHSHVAEDKPSALGMSQTGTRAKPLTGQSSQVGCFRVM